MSARDLIDAIATGDSVGIEKAFESAMASRIVDRLDAMRQDAAKNMFNEAACKTRMKAEEMDDDEEEDDSEEENLDEASAQARQNKDKKDEMHAQAGLKNLKDTGRLNYDTNTRDEATREGRKMARQSVKEEVHPDALHVQPVGKGKYKVHAVGKNFADGIKAGEHLNDSELDDFHEMGGKIKHVNPAK